MNLIKCMIPTLKKELDSMDDEEYKEVSTLARELLDEYDKTRGIK